MNVPHPLFRDHPDVGAGRGIVCIDQGSNTFFFWSREV